MSLDRKGTQAEFAALIGVTQPKVSQLLSDDVLHPDDTLAQWLRVYCARLREVAAGRDDGDAGGLSLTRERALESRERRRGLALKNAVARGEFAPIKLLAEVLAAASQAVTQRFEHLPGHLRKTCPEMTDTQRDAVISVIVAARNEWARATADLIARGLQAEEAADEEPEEAEDEPRAD